MRWSSGAQNRRLVDATRQQSDYATPWDIFMRTILPAQWMKQELKVCHLYRHSTISQLSSSAYFSFNQDVTIDDKDNYGINCILGIMLKWQLTPAAVLCTNIRLFFSPWRAFALTNKTEHVASNHITLRHTKWRSCNWDQEQKCKPNFT